jgi:predicted phosphodiesterase
MRIGLIADLHGNPIALRAVLTALEQEGIDHFVCLGDVAMLGPDPCGVLTQLRRLDCPVVMGNSDAWALDPTPHPVTGMDTPFINDIELWGAAQLSDADREYIASFQPTVEVALGREHRMLCYHGSPRSFDECLAVTSPDALLAEVFAGSTATVLAGGHTHVQMVRRFADQLVLNPGSVGQPFALAAGRLGLCFSPWSEYAVVEVVDRDLSVELRRIPVALDAIFDLAHRSGMPHAEWWIARWLHPAL